MNKGRTIVKKASLSLAFMLAFLAVWQCKGPDRKSRQVALSDITEVDRIVVSDSWHSTELLKVDDSWFLFGTEPVNPVSVENLLIAAERLEIGSIVDNEVPSKDAGSQDNTRNLSFFGGDKLILTYGLKYVSGRFLLIPPAAESAFFVSVPGYPDLDLGRVFSASPDHYRDHLLIDLRPSEISGIQIELASGEAFRFSQDREGNISCEAGNAHTTLPEGKPNELAMQLLFSYFTSLRYEKLSGIKADSLEHAFCGDRKLASIGVESFGGEQHMLKVFSYNEAPGSETHLFKALVLHNDRQEAIFVNYIYLDVLMRGLSHYFGEK